MTGLALVETSEELAAVVTRMARHPFVTVDTEFHRETTFWPIGTKNIRR